jgi:putative ABC transport system permease protein
MLKNYFKIAWRGLVRSKIYSLLILLGLSVGMTCAIVLGVYIHDELSFDRYHAATERIFRVNLHIKWETNEYNMALSSAPFGPTLKREYPEVQNMVRVKKSTQILKAGEKSVNVKDMIYADASLFSIFDYQFIEGNAAAAMPGINNIVVTEKLAQVLFGKTNGLTGKTILVKDAIPFTISGIIKDLPTNHHLKFEAVLPYENKEVSGVRPDHWDSFGTTTYVLLDNPNGEKLAGKMPAFYKKYIAKTIGDENDGKINFVISFQSLADIHLGSSHLMGEENGSNKTFIYTVLIIGLFILLIAIVNYINLAIARSTGRLKEIGVRKAVGSQSSQLIGQFLSESLMMVFLALGVSLVLFYSLLPFFNIIADKNLTLDILNIKTLLLFLACGLATGLLAGLYPAFVLSRFKPAAVLKGNLTIGGQGSLLRQSLIVLQFCISMVMISGTIIVYRQLHYMRNTDLGFNQQQVISIPLASPATQQSAGVFKNKLLQNADIKKVSLTTGSIGDLYNNKTTFSFYAKGAEQSISAEYFNVDQDFLDVLQIPVKDGTNFSAISGNDSADAVFVNQAMLKRLGWKSRTNGLIEIDTKKIEITGVINDFHLRSLHNQIEPLVLVLKKQGADKALIRIAGNNIPAALAHIKTAFDQTNPGQPFEYDFLDQAFARQYQADERKGTLFMVFSGVAIAISCVGLFGLSAFTAARRTKEIGVRKVLGASIANVATLLSANFIKPVLIGIVIATPVGWYAMSKWLNAFAYKMTIEWWIFGTSGLLCMIIALATVSFQSIKVALLNPVKSLRNE